MKVTCDPREITVSQTNLGKALGLTTGRIAQLVSEGVVFRDDNDKSGAVLLVKSVQSYDAFKSGSKKAADGESVDYMQEKALHEKTKREISELRLAKMERNVYDARTVELVLTEMLSNLRTQLLGLPAKLAPILDGKDKNAIYKRMTEEIEEKLSELSEYEPAMFADEVEDANEESD